MQPKSRYKRDTGKDCLLIFVKSPEKGKVKVRLSEDIDDDMVLSLYRSFVLDMLDTIRKTGHTFRIFFHPAGSEGKISEWLGRDLSYFPQEGRDLGERMKNALRRTFSDGFSRVLLMGSDVPDLTDEVIDAAFELNDCDAVIGPSSDGGYYLIGFKSFTFIPEIFEGIPWSTDCVFERTIKILSRYDYKIHVLSEWRDVDRLDDLKALVTRNRGTEFVHSRTMSLVFNSHKKVFSALCISSCPRESKRRVLPYQL
jgi:rSAM/selenodomain-associated transferase 1